MDKFLSEQELRARRARRAKARLAAIRNRTPLTMLSHSLEQDSIELSSVARPKVAVVESTELRSRRSLRPLQSPSFIIHSVEV